MLAFEELRKRLEEQHAQQLSLLIAEQEREQERLQKVSCQDKISEEETFDSGLYKLMVFLSLGTASRVATNLN